MSQFLDDVARLFEIPPRMMDLLRELIATGEVIVFTPELKVSLCEKLGLYREYNGHSFPSVNVIDQFLQELKKRGILFKEGRGTYRLHEILFRTNQDLVISYNNGERQVKLTHPQYENDRKETLR